MSVQSAIALIESISKHRVLFVGETIDDVYHYCTPLGRPLKDLVISVQSSNIETWRGGIVAASRHAEDFCSAVDVLSDRVIIKRRFIEQAHFRKLFQVYDGMTMLSFSHPSAVDKYDAVCVVDYGHGMMDDGRKQFLEEGASFLAVNVQVNSGNYGFNLATKYTRCDYLVVDETEARLATRNQFGGIEQTLEMLSKIAPKVIVTLGVKGAIGCDRDAGTSWLSSFTTDIKDTMGAGDAFFAVTAPMAHNGSMDDLLLIGNAAGALKAQSIGHSKPVTKAELISYLKDRHGTS